jgi:hypothetical protein
MLGFRQKGDRLMPDYDTKPTLETLLEEIRKGFAAVTAEINDVHVDLTSQIGKLERTQKRQDEKIDLFIAEVIELKRQMRHPV